MEGLGVESEEKREPASDIDTAEVDSLKVLDPEWPIREADILRSADYLRHQRILDETAVKTVMLHVARGLRDAQQQSNVAKG
jgi:hypothetical protein